MNGRCTISYKAEWQPPGSWRLPGSSPCKEPCVTTELGIKKINIPKLRFGFDELDCELYNQRKLPGHFIWHPALCLQTKRPPRRRITPLGGARAVEGSGSIADFLVTYRPDSLMEGVMWWGWQEGAPISTITKYAILPGTEVSNTLFGPFVRWVPTRDNF